MTETPAKIASELREAHRKRDASAVRSTVLRASEASEGFDRDRVRHNVLLLEYLDALNVEESNEALVSAARDALRQHLERLIRREEEPKLAKGQEKEVSAAKSNLQTSALFLYNLAQLDSDPWTLLEPLLHAVLEAPTAAEEAEAGWTVELQTRVLAHSLEIFLRPSLSSIGPCGLRRRAEEVVRRALKRWMELAPTSPEAWTPAAERARRVFGPDVGLSSVEASSHEPKLADVRNELSPEAELNNEAKTYYETHRKRARAAMTLSRALARPEAEPSERTTVYMNAAQVMMGSHDFQGAYEILTRVSEREPGHPRIWLRMAECAARLAAPRPPEWPRAVFDASLPGTPHRRHVGIEVASPRCEDFWVQAGLEAVDSCLLCFWREDEGREEVARVRNAATLLRAYLHLLSGQPSLALRASREVLEREEWLTAAQLAQAHAYMGEALMRLGRSREAEASAELEMRSAAACDPETRSASHVNMAVVLGVRGDVAGAESELNRALALTPSSPSALRNLIWVYAKLGAGAAAMEAVQTRRAVGPS